MSTEVETQPTTATRVLENYVGGRWRASGSERSLDVTDPATLEVLARVPLSSAGRARGGGGRCARGLPRVALDLGDRARAAAVRAARATQRVGGRAGPPGHARDGQDAGRRARRGRPHDRDGGVRHARSRRRCRDACSRTSRRDVDCETIRQPVGVCAAIVPFNFPAMVPFWFLPFAIGCGNTFVLKPSEQVPLTQNRVFEMLRRARPARRRGEPGQRRRRGGQRDPRLAGHRRGVVRRLGSRRASTSTSARPRAASACRRSAARRTTWS